MDLQLTLTVIGVFVAAVIVVGGISRDLKEARQVKAQKLAEAKANHPAGRGRLTSV